LRIGRRGFRSVVRVEDARGESGKYILSDKELFSFPRVGVGLSVQLRVTEHVFKVCVVEGTNNGGVESVPWGRGWGLAQWEGVGWGTRLGERRAPSLGWGGG